VALPLETRDGASAVRAFLPALSQALGQEFSIVNLAGSHGALAPTALLKEPPDGHTLLVGRGRRNDRTRHRR
jgi:tripartite-type tricarboxylate transporter receptor subunit TctC